MNYGQFRPHFFERDNMSTKTETPIVWKVQRLMCDCGGEFAHALNIKYADKPFAHACNKCGAHENHEHIYPHTVWEEVK
jgi:hypothetical protein